MIRELLWVLTALGGALILLLSKTWDTRGPQMEELLSVDTLWVFGKIYAGLMLARIAWWALRSLTRALSSPTRERSPRSSSQRV